MKQNKLTAWWGEKSKAPYGILNSETAAGTSINVIYRNMLSVMNITRSFEKMFHAQRSFTNDKKLWRIAFTGLFIEWLSSCTDQTIGQQDE